MNKNLDAIVLKGEDSINFINSLLRPTPEEIAENIRYFNQLDKEIKIREIEGGFEAEIEGLDLSFLHEHNKSVKTEYFVEYKQREDIPSNTKEVSPISVSKKQEDYNKLSVIANAVISVAA